MTQFPSTPLALALATLTSAAGCLHLDRAESAGDSARRSGDHAAAVKAYSEALDEDTDDVYAYEKERIWPKYTEMVSEELRSELKAPRKGGPHAVVAGLVALRSRAQKERLGPAIAREIQDAIDAEAMKGLPEIEAAAKANRYGEAMSLAAFYAGAVSGKHPLRARAQALASEAIAFHRGRSSTANRVGERLLHSRIAQAFGAPVDQEAATAVQAAVGVAWAVETKDSSCPPLDKGLTKALAMKVGAPGTLVLRLSCSTSGREFDRQESYSYTATETYQTTEEQSRLVAVAGASSFHVECPSNTVQKNGQMKPCVGVETRGPSDYKVEQVEVQVTKQRTVERTALRNTHRVEYTTTVTGEIAASARATGPDDNVVFTVPASFSATASAAEFNLPTPQVIPGDFGPKDGEKAALEKALGLVRALLSKVQEGRAIPYVKKADAAALGGDQAAAEDSFMIAAELIGRPDPSFASLLVKAYGFSPDDAGRAVFGARISDVAPPDSASSDKPPSFEETARFDWDYDLLFTWLVSPDVGPQPGRQALGGSIRVGSTVFTRFQETTWGFGFYDQAWVELFLGGRTAGFTDSTGEEEGRMAAAIELGYRPYLGYRTGPWGAFFGGRLSLVAQRVGRLNQSGALVSLAGAFEWRTGGHGALVLSGWATPALSGKRTLGAEFTLPFNRNAGGVKFGFEKRVLATSIPRTAGEDTTTDDIGAQDAFTMSVGLTVYDK